MTGYLRTFTGYLFKLQVVTLLNVRCVERTRVRFPVRGTPRVPVREILNVSTHVHWHYVESCLPRGLSIPVLGTPFNSSWTSHPNVSSHLGLTRNSILPRIYSFRSLTCESLSLNPYFSVSVLSILYKINHRHNGTI